MTEPQIRAAAQPLAEYLADVFQLDEELAIETAIKITERQLEALADWEKSNATISAQGYARR